MLTSRRRRFVGSRTLTTSLALAASVALAAAPSAAAESTAEADGTIAVSSLGSTNSMTGSAAGSLGSLASPAYAEYVALGDSYAAFGNQSKQAGFTPAGCGQSLTNYPKVLSANPAIGELSDVTCGGAEIPNLAGDQTVATPPGVASPQFAALSAGTDLVTLSIGGNDVGFASIVGCITRQGPFEDLLPEATCESQIGETIDTGIAGIFAQGGPVDTVYAAIKDASPDATVIATRYMPLMPAAGISCEFTNNLNPLDVAWAREVTEDINAAVHAAATRNGHTSVLPTDASDRSACASPDKRWTSFMGAIDDAAPFHPTALGQEAMAAAITSAL